MRSGPVRCVLFDLGGVVYDSPIEGIQEYEQTLGLERNALNLAIVKSGNNGAWAKLERGEISQESFYALFEADLAKSNIVVDGRIFMKFIYNKIRIRSCMVDAIHFIREAGYIVGAITNNWKQDDISDEMFPDVSGLFDLFVESKNVGIRKPDPAIYRYALTQANVSANECVFLDDIGINLKAAASLGMKTILVKKTWAGLLKALDELERTLEISLSSFSKPPPTALRPEQIARALFGILNQSNGWNDAIFSPRLFARNAMHPRGIVGKPAIESMRQLSTDQCRYDIEEVETRTSNGCTLNISIFNGRHISRGICILRLSSENVIYRLELSGLPIAKL